MNKNALNNLMWLLCDLQLHGKTLIRHGWRQGLPKEKASIWVFCPLQRTNFPRDRELVENCEICKHCSGLRFVEGMESSQKKEPKTTICKIDIESSKKVFSKEEIEKAEYLNKIEDEQWHEEEKKLHK